MSRDLFTCAICGQQTYPFRIKKHSKRPPNLATIGHRIAVSRGGTTDEINLQCECHRCNITKRNHVLVEDLERRKLGGWLQRTRCIVVPDEAGETDESARAWALAEFERLEAACPTPPRPQPYLGTTITVAEMFSRGC